MYLLSNVASAEGFQAYLVPGNDLERKLDHVIFLPLVKQRKFRSATANRMTNRDFGCICKGIYSDTLISIYRFSRPDEGLWQDKTWVLVKNHHQKGRSNVS